MIQFILAALIAIAPMANKGPEVYQSVVQPYVSEKIIEYTQSTASNTTYSSVTFKLTEFMESEKDDGIYLFHIQVIMLVIINDREEGVESTGIQGMNITVAADKDRVIYAAMTIPYWIHNEKILIGERVVYGTRNIWGKKVNR